MGNVNITTVIHQLPPYQGRERLINARQSVDDIKREILKAHHDYAGHYDKISRPFWKGSAQATAANLFQDMKRHIPYVVEKENFQSVKAPAAIIGEAAKYGADCKHYASMIVGIVDSLRRSGHPISACYCFAVYYTINGKGQRVTNHHVFAKVQGPDGRIYWTDPVLNHFDQRHPSPDKSMDQAPPAIHSMAPIAAPQKAGAIGALYRISGVGQEHAVHTHSYLPRIYRQEFPNGTEYTMHQQFRPHWTDMYEEMHGGPGGPTAIIPLPGPAEIGKRKGLHLKIRAPKIKIKLPKIDPGELLKKIGMAPSRNAFLALLKINGVGLAIDLNKAYSDRAKQSRLEGFWKHIGGNPNKLHTAIKQGVKWYDKIHHKNISGLGNEYETPFALTMGWTESVNIAGAEDNSMGIAPAAIPALLVAAAPVIAAAKNILSSLGINVSDLNKNVDDAHHKVAKDHNDAIDNGDVSDDGTVEHPGGVTTKVTKTKDGKQTMEVNVKDQGDESDGSDDESDGSDNTGKGAKSKKVTKKSDNSGDNAGNESGMAAYLEDAWSWVKDHKTYFYIGGGVIASVIIIRAIVSHKKKKRR